MRAVKTMLISVFAALQNNYDDDTLPRRFGGNSKTGFEDV